METSVTVKAGSEWLLAPEVAPPADLHLQKSFSTPVVDGGLEAASRKTSQPTESNHWSSRRITLVSGWLLVTRDRGPHLLSWPVISGKRLLLAGFLIQNIAERLQLVVWALDCYALLLFHMGTKGTARGELEHIESDYMALRVKTKDIGSLPMRGKGSWWSEQILRVNNCLCIWCQKQGFGF